MCGFAKLAQRGVQHLLIRLSGARNQGAGKIGGKALLDNNDLDRGIVNAQHADSDYYILGYYTSNTAVNGKFRKVKVTLNSEMAANLDFRQGYFGEKEWGKFNTADKERQLEDALMQGDPFVELTVAVEINYFELNKAEYYVPWARSRTTTAVQPCPISESTSTPS